jgi:polysaccharide deacetylase 2 family uncharacterized protein YibQ
VKRSPGRKLGGLLLFLAGLGAGALLLYWLGKPAERPRWGGKDEKAPQEAAPPTPVRRPPSDHVEPEAPAVSTAPEPSGPVQGVRVALVIDDLGRSVDELDPLFELGVPVAYAVLPFHEQTAAVVAALKQRQEEILLHLPMEPKNGEDPGPGALVASMDAEELRQRTVEALRAVSGAVGVNNHMGSALSADPRAMRAVLGVLARRNLFFLDSRTSAESVAYKPAIDLGIPAAERQVFLDGDPAPEAIHLQLARLLAVARERGAAIAIGHPYPETLAALASEVPRAKELGYEFVPVSYLLDRPGGE